MSQRGCAGIICIKDKIFPAVKIGGRKNFGFCGERGVIFQQTEVKREIIFACAVCLDGIAQFGAVRGNFDVEGTEFLFEFIVEFRVAEDALLHEQFCDCSLGGKGEVGAVAVVGHDFDAPEKKKDNK